jgi:hypothetical protein
MENPFVTIATIHKGDISWWWTDERLHDPDYHIKVNESISKKAEEVARKYGVESDSQYRTQFEGVCIEGEEREAVEKAALEIACHLSRFQGVRPL